MAFLMTRSPKGRLTRTKGKLLANDCHDLASVGVFYPLVVSTELSLMVQGMLFFDIGQ